MQQGDLVMVPFGKKKRMYHAWVGEVGETKTTVKFKNGGKTHDAKNTDIILVL